MTDAKKSSAPKTIVDVAHPGKSAPSGTSKPVIVTNRPMLKDPMVTAGADGSATGMPDKEAAEALTKPTEKPDLQPAKVVPVDEAAPAAKEESEAPEPATPAPEPKAPDTPDSSSDDVDKNDASPAAQTAEQEDAAAEKKAKHDADIQKLAEAKKYFLPINAVEKRRTKRVIALGVVLSILLALAWVDIAMDAGLIQVGSVKPVTHFFSN